MKKAIMAKKIGMTQIFDQETGEMIPVTVLEAGPCCVTQVKTVEHDGYAAIQVGFGEIREKLVNKPLKGHFAKAGVSVKRHIEEFKIEGAEGFELGAEIKADVFEVGDKVDVSGISKGKGYQGAIHRHGFARVRWSMVLNITAMQVPWVHPVIPLVYSKAKSCPVTWVTRQSLFRIWKLYVLTLSATCC